MKKTIIILLAIVFVFTGCSKQKEEPVPEPKTLTDELVLTGVSGKYATEALPIFEKYGIKTVVGYEETLTAINVELSGETTFFATFGMNGRLYVLYKEVGDDEYEVVYSTDENLVGTTVEKYGWYIEPEAENVP